MPKKPVKSNPSPPSLAVAAMVSTLPPPLEEAVRQASIAWRETHGTERLWARDTSLWSGTDEDHWLGWLDACDTGIARLPLYAECARDVHEAEYEHVLLLGMGGSSLGPEVVAKTFGQQRGWPRLHVLDSTDPRQIRAVEAEIDYVATLFIVSSKSGSTLEVSILLDYFLSRAQAMLGPSLAKRQFIAITDPGSSLDGIAKATGFSHVFAGEPSVGGRFSVLSPFGLIPATTLGVDLGRYLHGAKSMADVCRVTAGDNPAVTLGITVAEAARMGRDKLTILAGPGLESFGGWAEQLVAESTGKLGKAIIPVDGEALGAPDLYGADRLFVHLSFADRPDPEAGKLAQLSAAGHPVLSLTLTDTYQLGQEFFRWEVATAVAGSLLAVHPFDQPDVEASKIATKQIAAGYVETGKLPSWPVFAAAPGFELNADPANTEALATTDPIAAIKAHLARIATGDYLAILAYLPHSEAVEAPLRGIRLALRDRYRIATSLQFGPRFLHSTGQAHKGGPNTGVFLQITTSEPDDLAVPGRKYSFGIVKAAQAQGDAQVLAERGRRLLCIHITGDLISGLEALAEAIDKALV